MKSAGAAMILFTPVLDDFCFTRLRPQEGENLTQSQLLKGKS